MPERHISGTEPSLDLSTFVGQSSVVRDLRDQIDRARAEERNIDHLLFAGPRKMGKSTLAVALANELGCDIRIKRSKDIERAGDLAAILTNVQSAGIILIEDIDSLRDEVLPVLLPAVSDFSFHLTIGKGPSAREIDLRLPRFILIGTTGRPSQIDKSLAWWMTTYDFTAYSRMEMSQMVLLMARRQGFEIERESSNLLALHSEGSPGHAYALVKRIGARCTSIQATKKALESIGYSQKPSTSVELASYLSGLSGSEFEEYVAKLFQRMGYQAEITGQSGDHGIDLMVTRSDEVIAIQCKRWSDSIGEAVVRDFSGALSHSVARIGCIMTTSTFTENARQFSRGKPIKLVDIDGLIQLILKYRRD